MLVGGAPETIALPIEQCLVPQDIDGPVYVFLASSDVPLSADISIQDQATTLAGPGVSITWVPCSHPCEVYLLTCFTVALLPFIDPQ